MFQILFLLVLIAYDLKGLRGKKVNKIIKDPYSFIDCDASFKKLLILEGRKSKIVSIAGIVKKNRKV